MLRAVQLNLMAENVEILNSQTSRDNVNLYIVKNTRENCDDTEFRPQ